MTTTRAVATPLTSHHTTSAHLLASCLLASPPWLAGQALAGGKAQHNKRTQFSPTLQCAESSGHAWLSKAGVSGELNMASLFSLLKSTPKCLTGSIVHSADSAG